MNDPDLELDVEVFRGGNYGPKGAYAEHDIEAIAANYDPARHEAPVTLDHAQHGPAHGWVKRLRRLGDRLVATLWKVSPSLREWLRNGAYRKCSVELYRSFRGHNGPYLKAVSFLGAAAPEVKGLQPPVFAEDAPPPRETPHAPPMAAAEPGAPEPAALALPDEPESIRLMCETALPHPRPESVPREPARTIVRAAFASLKREGRFLPAWEKTGVEAFAELLVALGDHPIPPADDAAADPAAAPSPWRWFLEFLGSLPPQVAFREIAHAGHEDPLATGLDWTTGIPAPAPRAALCPRSIELHRETVHYMNQHPGVAYSEALRAVARG